MPHADWVRLPVELKIKKRQFDSLFGRRIDRTSASVDGAHHISFVPKDSAGRRIFESEVC